MKLLKRIPFQIFILVLLAGVVGIVGMVIMQYNINAISDNYEQIIDEKLRDRLDMSMLREMMYNHQEALSQHILADSEEKKAFYEEDGRELEQRIMDKLAEMGKNIQGGEKEQLFHKVYSDTISYFQNAKNIFSLSNEGNAATAKFYLTSTMADFMEEINNNVILMDEYVAAEMDETDKKMDNSIKIAQISETVCIVFIIAAVLVCSVLCVNITSRMEKYKDQLERDVENKTQQLIEHSRKMLAIQDKTIIGLANLIESRDDETGGHVKRTSRYVELLARAAQECGYCKQELTDEYIELLVKAAPMHDIGKIVVSDEILKKPGPLTAEEFSSMQRHAGEGGKIVYEVLYGIEDKAYIDIAAQVAEGHHEKWDGSGYPQGLKGDEIPVCARIMAVADVFDALVSKRCYKDPMSMDAAFEIIEESAGSHFDPELARIFLSIRDKVEQVPGE